MSTWEELSPSAPDGHVRVARSQWETTVRNIVFSNKITITVALLLATYADNDGGEVRPSQETLARSLTYGTVAASTRSVRTGVKELRETGFLREVERGSNTGTRAASSRYVLTVPVWVWEKRSRSEWDDRTEEERRGVGYRPAPLWTATGERWTEPAPQSRKSRKPKTTGNVEPHPTTGSVEPVVGDHRKHSADHRKHSALTPGTTGSTEQDDRKPTSTYPLLNPPRKSVDPLPDHPAGAGSATDGETAPAYASDADGGEEEQQEEPDPAPEADVPPGAIEAMEDDGMTDPGNQRAVWAKLLRECGTPSAALARLRVPPPSGPDPEPDQEPVSDPDQQPQHPDADPPF